ncbi:hypothetical protein [Streptomyces sp. t39]|uniref:hypothetical protein n=1 Tax=Streptomyces sp. t39 TaxID=1828156 RepID=UPI0011CE06C6|nr:hypothetical protein [Streptomyces sp. t39]TXS35093.1 hypothetical protein EAO77_38000 [Streptomyces sp. t39]
MTGPQHYKRAEEQLRAAEAGARIATLSGSPAQVELIALAQVHATLALAAATALPPGDPDSASRQAWVRAVALDA